MSSQTNPNSDGHTPGRQRKRQKCPPAPQQITEKFGYPSSDPPETYFGFSAFTALDEKDQSISSLANCILMQFPVDESIIDINSEISRNIYGSSTYAVALEFSESQDYKNLSDEIKEYISSRGGSWNWTDSGGYTTLREVLSYFC
jgi:hypothetical protein